MQKRFAVVVLAASFSVHLHAQVTGSGTTNVVPKWTGSTAIGDSAISEVSGSVGIGTTSPSSIVKLHLYGTETSDAYTGMGTNPSTGPAFNIGYSGASFGRGSAFLNVRPDASASAPNPSLRFMTVNVQRMIITNTGAIGIGTSFTPAAGYLFDVNGAAHFSGDVTVDGNLGAKYQDVAEWVPATTDMAPGTVVVLNPDAVNEVMPSERAYDTSVAGVVSARPGLILGEAGESREQIATTGRVKVRVDASRQPIRVGDLLVTSDVPGTAMRSEPLQLSGRSIHQPGTIVGKALEPLREGTGEILVLLSLQ